MPDLAFERLTSANAGALAELLENVDKTHFEHTSRKSVADFLAQPSDIHLIGLLGGKPIVFGMLRGWHDGYRVPSLGIAVRGGQEGKGHAKAMMQALEVAARERGSDQIRLRVHPANARARRLYLARGYVERGLERDQILMTLDLEHRKLPSGY